MSYEDYEDSELHTFIFCLCTALGCKGIYASV